ncbi:motilin receptor-like [Hyperolius riggenbachi]|uniref:motilin receptor-like n=1 Tax=Hyperolius riggenbachi TaxID=752182 RepID=UPI0035A38893
MENTSAVDNISRGVSNEDIPPCTETICSFFTIKALIPTTIVCLIIMVTGLVGNTITILIIKRYKEMNTTTNFYLSSMAVSDVIILLCLPFDLYRLWLSTTWIFGRFLCKFLCLISEACTYSTILHITALSIERYLAICFPLKAKVFITKRRVKFVIVLLWIVALLSAAPLYNLINMQAVNGSGPYKNNWQCRYTEHALKSGFVNIMVWVTTVYFFFPMFCLTILYGFIGKKLWKSKNSIQGPNAANRQKCHRQTVKILALVVLAFVICWLPFHIGRIIFANSTMDYEKAKISQYFNIVALPLYYLSASINPILYNLISKKYRAAAYRLLRLDRHKDRAYNVIRDETGGHTEVTVIHNEYITHI